MQVNIVKNYTSAFFRSGSRWRLTKSESPASGRTYKANSDRFAFFSNKTQSAEMPPARQYTRL